MEHFSDSDEAFFEDLFGRGLGDPDVHGHYPGDGGEATCRICTPIIVRKKHWRKTVSNTHLMKTNKKWEYGDNNPADPEQAWA
jgi:hypothetical protein